MVSLRTLLLWVAVVAFGVVALFTSVVSLAVVLGEAVNAHIWIPIFLASLAGLVLSAIAAQRSSERDQRELPPYESALFSSMRAVALAVVSIFFAVLAVLVLVNVPDAIESQSCSSFGGGEGPTFERCTTENDYWELIPSSTAFLLTFLAAVGGAVTLWRDHLSSRFHLARGH